MKRALLLALALVVGCGGSSGNGADAGPPDASPDAAVAPVFRNPVALPDADLAKQALQLLGASVAGANTSSCNGCHGVTKQHLAYWRALSDTSMSSCLTDLSVATQASAQQMINCMRSMPALATSDFDTKKLGIFATAAKLPWFQYAFQRAYGDDHTQLDQFLLQAAMPKEGVVPLTQPQFDIVAEWFARGLPMLDQTLVTDPAPTTCDSGISSEVAAHVDAIANTNWRKVNAMNQMAMFGCGAETDPKLCLQAVPLASTFDYGTGWDLPGKGHARILKDVTYTSSYWTRSSPDGRFVAHGVDNVTGSYVIDLQRDAIIPISAQYDPGFFPDNSGFVFQGGPGKNTCGMSVLTSNPASITMNETACRKIANIGLYQHVGQMLGAGGDYFAIDSEFVSDDGGKGPTFGDPDTNFGTQAYSSFTAMMWNGTTYAGQPSVNVDTPFEGDTVLSPSAKLTIGRVAGPGDHQLGFVLRKVNATPAGSNFTVESPEIARYCTFEGTHQLTGGKPAFSFDEKMITFHHYIKNSQEDAVDLGFTGFSDPGFLPYVDKGTSNIFIMDIRTGHPVRVTNMAAGQYALYPHFRSDGWIYFLVRDNNTGHEYVSATDAALILE